MNRYKYPSTPHLPFSNSRTDDDSVLGSVAHFLGKKVVITKKMDGENTSMYCDGFHARSIDGRHHCSRDWVAAYHASFAIDIPVGWRICGENLYAKHSVGYTNLPSYFMGFSIWNDQNVALSWEDTLEYFDLLGIEPVPVIECGIFNEKMLKELIKKWDTTLDEGFVVRLADSIAMAKFDVSFAKWVRPKHVQTNDHWMHQAVVVNGLMKS